MMWLLVTVAFAAEGESARDFRSYLDQARFFLRKEWYGDALEQLEAAVATEDGSLDPEAWFLLAKVRYELGDLPGARFAADRALVRSRDQEQARQANELLSFFEQQFGYVTVNAPVNGMTTTLQVTLESTIFDPDLKVWLNRAIEKLKDPVSLPYDLGLPAARYTINGVEVEILPGATQQISPQLDNRATAPLQALRIEVGLGASGTMGARVSNLHPAPTADLGVGMPFGPLFVGALGAWSVQPYATRDGANASSWSAWSLGLRVGIELPLSIPVELRPAATWRLASVPGIEVGCASSGGSWGCEQAAALDELFVYTTATAHAVGLELSASTRPQPVGFGLRTAGEIVLGTLPQSGRAVGPDGPLDFSVADPRGLGGGGWRVLGVVVLRP